MTDTQILWSYPLVFRCIRRVDAKYAYLVVNDGYVPLRRREGVLRTFLPYVKYGKWLDGHETHYFITLMLETIDELSTFFQTRMLNEEYSELAPKEEYRSNFDHGEIWDELNGVQKDTLKCKSKKEEYKHKVLPPKHVDPCSITVTFEEECDVRKKLDDQHEKLNHY